MRVIDKLFLGVFCTLFVMMVVLMLVVGGMEQSFQSMSSSVDELLERPAPLPSPQDFLGNTMMGIFILTDRLLCCC
jgi:hypothetical protein